MKTWIVEAQQGSDAWHAHRAKSYNASDLACAMGIDPNGRKRADLVKQYATGWQPEYDAATLARFARGHEIEAVARGIVESATANEFFPVVMAGEADGITIGASMDGLTMDGAVLFECKSRNGGLYEAVQAGIVPEAYRPQLEQQMLLSGAELCLFTVSDGTEQGTIWTEYRSDPALRARIIPTWQQFAEDVRNYQPVEVLPAAVAAPIQDLPALAIEITGRVVASNLAAWRDVVMARIAGIKTDLSTDQDFATAESTVKFLDDGERRIELVKAQAQAQAADIDTVFRAMDEIKAGMRAKRLELDKLVKARKESIRAEIIAEARAKIDAHVEMLNARIGKPWMPRPVPDFAGSIKGKKTVASLRDGVDTELARSKIAANEAADKIELNLKRLRELTAGYEALFADAQQLVMKDTDALEAIAKQRIAEHQAAEAKRLEAERERIAAEERAKILASQNMTAATAAIPAPASASATIGTGDTPEPGQRETPPTLKLGDICARLHPLAVTADALKHLGFEPLGTERAAKLYREADFPRICAALVAHIQSAAGQSIRRAA